MTYIRYRLITYLIFILLFLIISVHYYNVSQDIFKEHVIADIKSEFFEMNYTMSDYLYSGKLESFLIRMDESRNINHYFKEINILDSDKNIILSTSRNKLSTKCLSELVNINAITLKSIFSNVKYFMPVVYQTSSGVEVYYITAELEEGYFRESIMKDTLEHMYIVVAGFALVFMLVILMEYKLIISPLGMITRYLKDMSSDLPKCRLKELQTMATSMNESYNQLMNKNKYIRQILDSQTDIVLVTTGTELLDVNQSFFNFFSEYRSISDFMTKHKCICDLFIDINKEDYLTKNDKQEKRWVKKVSEESDTAYKAQILRGGIDHIFSVRGTKIKSDPDVYVVSFADITLLENYSKNITHMVETEISKRMESEAKYEFLFNSMTEGHCIHGYDEDLIPTTFLEVNDRMVEMTGYSREELLAMTPVETHAELPSDNLSNLAEQIHQQGQLTFEASLRRKDGSTFIAELSSKIIGLYGEKMVFTSIRDVTERKRMEMEYHLHESLLAQQSKLSALGEMIGSITHQWKQPLNVINLLNNLAVSVIQDRKPGTPLPEDEIVKYMDDMQTHITFLGDTISDFSNFFKPSKEAIDFSVSEVVSKVFSMMEHLYKTEGISLKIVKEEDADDRISGIPNDIKQVFLNLFNNSRDAYISRRNDGKFKGAINNSLTISIRREANRLIIEYMDNCGGIPEEILANMFQPYNTSKNENGTGIGMYMTRQIIEKMNGTIHIENTATGIKATIRL